MTFGQTSGRRRRREPGMLLPLGAGAEMVPDDEQNYRGGENEQAGGNEREPEIGKRDQPEGTPRSRAEIERGFFLAAVHFLQAGKDFRGGDGNKRGAVAEEYQRQAALEAGKHGEHQHGQAGDDAGKNERKQNETPKQSLTGEIG